MSIILPNGNCVVSLPPCPDDLFVMTTLFGRRVFVQPVSEYEEALNVAEAFACSHAQSRPFTVKVLCLELREGLEAMGLQTDDLFRDQTPADEGDMRRQVVATYAEAIQHSPDERVRKDAFQLYQKVRGGS